MTNEEKIWKLRERVYQMKYARGEFSALSPADWKWLDSLSIEEMESILASK